MARGRTHIIVEQNSLALTTLAGNTSLLFGAAKIDNAREMGVKLVKVKAHLEWRNKTSAEGPILGFMSIGLNASEASAFFEADPQRHEDPDSSEASQREVFPFAVIPERSSNSGHVDPHLRDIRAPSWEVPEGVNLNFGVHNLMGSSLTTGTICDLIAIIVCRWLDD